MGTPVTLLTCAEFYRKDPLVKLIPWDASVLLFSRDDFNVRVRRSWRFDDELADYALSVSRMLDDDGNPYWLVQTHPESPSKRLELPRSRFIDQPPYHVDTSIMRFAETAEQDRKLVKPGEILRFSFAPKWLHREVRLMLTNYDEGKDHPAQTDHVRLQNLPPEVMQAILSRVPVPTVVQVLPFVSTDMFYIAKEITIWKAISFDRDFICGEDLHAIYQLGRDTCEELAPMEIKEDSGSRVLKLNSAVALYSMCLIEHRWPKVKTLHVQGEKHGLDPLLVNQAITRGNFPALKSLHLMWPKASIGWSILERSKCVNLTRLEIQIDVPSVLKDPAEFWTQLKNLKSLALKVTTRECWNTLFPAAGRSGKEKLFENLEEFSLLELPEPVAPLLENALAPLHGGNVNTLVLDRFEPPDSDRETIPGYLLATKFPHMASLNLGGWNYVDWTTAREDWLLRIKRFKGRIDTDTNPAVPFEKMLNLETAVVESSFPLDNPEEKEACRALLQLPKLDVLDVQGDIDMLKIAKANPDIRCSASRLVICFLQAAFDGEVVQLHRAASRDLARILGQFPKVQHLELTFEYVTKSNAAFARLLRRQLRKGLNLVDIRVKYQEGVETFVNKLQRKLGHKGWRIAYSGDEEQGEIRIRCNHVS